MSTIKWINEKHRFIRDLIIFIIAYRLGVKGFCWLLEIAPAIISSMEESGIYCVSFLNALFKIYIGLIMVFKLCLVCNTLKLIIVKTIQFFKSNNMKYTNSNNSIVTNNNNENVLSINNKVNKKKGY